MNIFKNSLFVIKNDFFELYCFKAHKSLFKILAEPLKFKIFDTLIYIFKNVYKYFIFWSNFNFIKDHIYFYLSSTPVIPNRSISVSNISEAFLIASFLPIIYNKAAE